jgi:hypothetical protein
MMSKIPTWAEIIVTMFARQTDLMAKFKVREGLPDWPLELHTKDNQQLLRNFAWRMTEELTEAYAELLHGSDRVRLMDELADATHYMIEMLVFSGMSVQHVLMRHAAFPIIPRNNAIASAFWMTTYSLGFAMQFLRTRPWKDHEPPMVKFAFQNGLNETFGNLLMLWASTGATPIEMYEAYIQKSEVNHQRLEPK